VAPPRVVACLGNAAHCPQPRGDIVHGYRLVNDPGGNHGETLAGPGASWRSLPALPPGTATLAPGPAGGLDALAVDRTRLTVWQLAPGSAAWAKAQTINVPVQFGSSS